MAASYFGENFGQGPSTLAISPPTWETVTWRPSPPPPHPGDRHALMGEIARWAGGRKFGYMTHKPIMCVGACGASHGQESGGACGAFLCR